MLKPLSATINSLYLVTGIAMCRLWYVLSGCSKLTALRLLGEDGNVSDCFRILPPEFWDLVPRGLTAVKFEGPSSSLGFLYLLDGLRELEITGGNFAALLNGHKKQGPEVESSWCKFTVVLPFDMLLLRLRSSLL